MGQPGKGHLVILSLISIWSRNPLARSDLTICKISMKSGHIYIGTSAWSYKSWAEAFYPSDLPTSQQLGYCTTKFPTVGVNRTFYSLPTEKALCDWKRTAPSGFPYSLKGSRAVTHFKRLQPGAKSLNLLLDRSKLLGGTRGPLLWQLPRTLKKGSPSFTQFHTHVAKAPTSPRHRVPRSLVD
jgi:uncharacterized protein YecE (DUF72 family)